MTPFVVQGKMIAPNPLRRVLKPRALQRAQLKANSEDHVLGETLKLTTLTNKKCALLIFKLFHLFSPSDF